MKLTKFETTDYLKTKEDIRTYLTVSLEDYGMEGFYICPWWCRQNKRNEWGFKRNQFKPTKFIQGFIEKQ